MQEEGVRVEGMQEVGERVEEMQEVGKWAGEITHPELLLLPPQSCSQLAASPGR